jgi:hypothetical protein
MEEAMTTKRKIEIVAAALLLLALVAALVVYVHEREDRLRAEYESKVAQAAKDAAEKTYSDAQKRIEQREAEYQKQLQATQDLIKSVQTPQQAVKSLPQVVTLPQPIYIPNPSTTIQSKPGEGGNDGGTHQQNTADAVIPAESVKPLFDKLAQCRQAEAALLQCQLTLDDKKDQDEALRAEIDALKKEVDAWKHASKGGTKLTRLKRGGKLLVIGAVLGEVVRFVLRGKP